LNFSLTGNRVEGGWEQAGNRLETGWENDIPPINVE